MKEKDSFILDIKRLGINGEGIGFYNRMAVFVPNAIPGEGHLILVEKVDGKMAFGKTEEIKHSSKFRVVPSCPYYNECGGCNTSHIDYKEMLKFKREAIIEALGRYTKINYRQFEIKPTVESEKIFGYRNRSQLAIRKDMDFKYTTTMLKEKSNQAINIKECMVQDPNINRINNEILKIADELEIPPYVAKYNRGGLRYLVTRVNTNGEALVCIICAEKNSKIKDLAKRVMDIKGVKGVYESFNNSKKENTFFGDEINHLEGSEYIVESIGNIKYRIYPNTFFQLNTLQAKKMYDLVLKACKLSRKERVLDAYCGVGTIGLYLAHMAKEVVGIEYNKDSVFAANENAKMNKIKNATFLQGDAKELLPKMIKDGQTFDVLVVDPPRVGLGEEFINTILEAKIPRLVYASCNPATLAKDLEILSKAYQINYITPLDMFPQTAHVEMVTTLVRVEDESENKIKTHNNIFA